ncbi:MAG TPA: hypothetical protein VGR08_13665 [Thermomicrobiales bacterium]|nr:hypothetical protein [Thermomicrobiales bacterium]
MTGQHQIAGARPLRGVPAQLVAGVILVGVSWPLAWFGPAPFSEHTFFPLWLGYILTVDGLAYMRGGTSLLMRDHPRFVLLFAMSIPLWWLFEFANEFLRNWRYIMARQYGPVAYGALASLAFSTVMPAVFVTAELYRTFSPFARVRRWIRLVPSRAGQGAIAVLGLAMFVASLAFPDVAFPLVWIGVFLFLDAINALIGGRSLAEQVAAGRWDTVLVLFAAGITCGFFWEMWNIRSLPKWVYDVPHVTGPKLFEMPLLGYGGYLPFALEIYAFYHFAQTAIFRRRDTYLCFDRPPGSGLLDTG